MLLLPLRVLNHQIYVSNNWIILLYQIKQYELNMLKKGIIHKKDMGLKLNDFIKNKIIKIL